MPRNKIDYSKTIIYKLCCNDISIIDIYVGHTTNFKARKDSHKNRCNDSNNKKHNFYVYQFIREHGSWDNWSMIEIEKINCIDEIEARKNERRHIELLGATLNKQIPTRTQQEYREDNKDTIKKKKKEFYEENKDTILEQKKQYRETNKYIIKEKKKEWYELNKEEFNKKRKEKRTQQKELKN